MILILALAYFVSFSFCAQPSFHSGFIEVNPTYGANLYYYFVPSQNDPTTDPVVLWLQGGPGCSSLFGAFVENGPQLITETGAFIDNPYSWNLNASVIFIDSPVGAGYSYVNNPIGYETNEKAIAQDLEIALKQFFFVLFPQYSKLDFYIFGESYAGKYVPWLAYTLITTSSGINLRGIGVGDGWVNPYYQTASYAPYLYENKLINEVELGIANTLAAAYQGLIDIGSYVIAQDVGNALLELLVTEAGGVNVYDIRTTSDPTDPLSAALSTYLNTPSVQAKMNASGHAWTSCSSVPYLALIDDLARSSEYLFPVILAKIPVLLYNGNYDLICDYLGTNTWASIIEWPHQQEFNNALNRTWIVDGQNAGYYKTASTLTHLIVYNAGHMVPYNQPKNSLNMLQTFIKGGFRK
eukprot:TRINITY_DN4550_c0_g1_i1.p1 TRINITY_DN4550_c0_g1~~TRINITY_DN4550_c0_g1_i1.p1  ORF type:complete len:410 (-),score=50.14 TRINITY_DN4550_c0_g1_i1:21-1250(-)